MKKNYLWSLFSMTLFVCLVGFTSCSDDDDDPSVVKKCATTPQNILRMCDGFAYNFKHEGDVKYYYYKSFTKEDYNKLSKEELIRQVDTGNPEDRNLQDPDNYACTYHCRPNTEYVLVTVSYHEDGTRGELVTIPTTTKANYNQPLATLTGIGYDESFENYVWQSKRNDYCSQYYTYACVAKTIFPTMLYYVDDATPILAWAIKNEMDKNRLDHICYINSLGSNGTERFYAAKYNDGSSKLEANIISDNYLQVVTWGADSNGELSGLLDDHVYDFTSNETKINSDATELFAFQTKKNKKQKDYSTPKSVILNSRDIQVFRVQ